jgi:hypothetical protein
VLNRVRRKCEPEARKIRENFVSARNGIASADSAQIRPEIPNYLGFFVTDNLSAFA